MIYTFKILDGWTRTNLKHPHKAPALIYNKMNTMPVKLIIACHTKDLPMILKGKFYEFECEMNSAKAYEVTTTIAGVFYYKEVAPIIDHYHPEDKEDKLPESNEITTDDINGAVGEFEEENDKPESSGLTITEDQITKIPVIDFETSTLDRHSLAVENFQLYQYVMNKIVNKDDYHNYGNKPFLKKSGFKKLALAFELDDREVELTIEKDNVMCRATVRAPNGRTSVDYGVCELSELNKPTKHNMITMAITRAKSRAISNLVGCGLVSAEEL
ncbi:MAG: hypothetical protein V3V41_07980 [Candidatus Heimdallarchaeota archaeon]